MQIKYESAADTIIAHGKVRWNHYRTKMVKLFAFGYIVAAALYWFGANTDTFTTSHTDRNGTVSTSVDYHITESLSIIVFAFTTFVLITFFKSRARLFSDLEAVAARWRARYANEMTITVDAAGIEYATPESRLEVKWPLVMSYSQYREYTFIRVSENWYSAIIVDNRLLSAEEKEELSGLLHRNDVLER